MATNGDSAASQPWHEAADATLARLESTAEGLTGAEAGARLARDGENRLKQKPPRPAWRKLVDQLDNVLVFVLMGAAVVAGAVGDVTDAVVIVAVIVSNACLGYFQEHRAEATLAALQKMSAPHAKALRDGVVSNVDVACLVVGDVVSLDAGDRVPADGRVLQANDAQLAEAALTGESHPVEKQVDALPDGKHPLAERANMVFMNTVVTRGRLRLLVTSVGMNTEMGRITGLLDTAEPRPTPLQAQLDGLGKHLAIAAGVVVSIVFGLGLLRGEPVVKTLIISIALAVAAIPEGLPAVVTVTLAIGMRRMASNRAIVKKLAAVETLGSTSVICADKTGTLTLNEMTARELFFGGRVFAVTGEGYSAKGRISAVDRREVPDLAVALAPVLLCNESSIRGGKLVGDPTEGALVALAMKGGMDSAALLARMPRVAEIPFDAEHKFMATFHHGDGADVVTMFVKGAPDVLLGRAVCERTEGGDAPLDDAGRARWVAENERLASSAMRVLAVARREIPARDFDATADRMPWASDLCLVALVGLHDPPRPEARAAIVECNKAGIQVKMITGDSTATAGAIAALLGLPGVVVSGAQLDGLDAEKLSALVEATSVFARVAPEHKVSIVKALQARGHVVAMTGDGVNDAPALKHADIGVAMGVTGTEVAKEAASMVLTDDNFVTIVGAVKEGRTIYDNIVKFVRFQLSTNIGAILTVLGAQVLGLPTPFTAIQLLWINIIMDGPPAMTLGLEPARAGIMSGPPRRGDAKILTPRRLATLAMFGAVMAAGTLGVFVYARGAGSMARATTLAFTTFVLCQFFNVFNARAEEGTVFRKGFFANGRLWVALAGVVGAQILVVELPMAQSVFHTTSLAPLDWAMSFAVASCVLWAEETRKLLVRLFGGRRAQPDSPAALPAEATA